MTERDCVHFGDTTIEYEVRRSARRRKTVQVTVAGGGVQVAASTTTPDSELRAIVRKRAPWILNHASGEMLEAAPKRFVSGETLPYLDRNVRMIVESVDMRSPEVRFDHWRFRVSVPQSLDGGERYELIRRAVGCEQFVRGSTDSPPTDSQGLCNRPGASTRVFSKSVRRVTVTHSDT